MKTLTALLSIATVLAATASAAPHNAQEMGDKLDYGWKKLLEKEKSTINNGLSTKYQRFLQLVNLLSENRVAEIEDKHGILDLEASEQVVNVLTPLTKLVGTGYNMLEANPEGDFRTGGEDPGIKKTRYILKLSDGGQSVYYKGNSVEIPEQIEFHASDSCSKEEKSHAYWGQTSYRDELDLNIETSAKYSGVFTARFSLSTAMKNIESETQNQKKVVVQRRSICNYGTIRYKMANAEAGVQGYELTDEFKRAVKNLPTQYYKSDYIEFIDNWGTHFLEKVTVGTRKLTRKEATYKQVLKFLSEQNNVGLNFGGKAGGVRGSVTIDVKALDETVKETSEFGYSLNTLDSGSTSLPAPIIIKPISIMQVLEDFFWTGDTDMSSSTLTTIKTNLQRALGEYEYTKSATIHLDNPVRVEIKWPDSKFSLPAPSNGCPQGWSSGWRYQDDEDAGNANSWSPSDIANYLKIDTGSDIKSYFCTKTKTTYDHFDWPHGTYCIARYGGQCPEDFTDGYRKWDDEDNGNANSKSGTLPDGEYGYNTKIQFCCRSDGQPSHSAILPISSDFVLYRYQDTCQTIAGMKPPKELKVFWDDDDFSFDPVASECSGEVPSGECGLNNAMYYCFYAVR